MKVLGRCALVLLGLLMSGRAALAEAPAPAFRTEDVRYRNGEIELAALLLLPSSEDGFPPR